MFCIVKTRAVWRPSGRVKSSVNDQQLDNLARVILAQEYASLRAEILASYGYAQAIVRWTLATFGAVMAAGLIAIYNSSSGGGSRVLFLVVLLIFGAGLPGIIWLSAWTWLGELYRAERAGSYLRHLEGDIARIPGLTDRFGFQPARWESFILANRKSKGLWGKQTMTYLGTAGVFFGTVAGSCAIYVILWIYLSDAELVDGHDFIWLGVLSSLITIVGTVGSFVVFRKLMKLGRGSAPVEASYISLDSSRS